MKKSDLILGVFLGGVSVIYLWQTYQIPSGAHLLNSSRSFPLFLGIALSLLSALIIVSSLLKVNNRGEKSGFEMLQWTQVKRGIFFVGWFATYIFIGIPLLKFLFATVVFMIVGLLYFRELKWPRVFGVSAGTLIFIYLIFNQLMYIKLP